MQMQKEIQKVGKKKKSQLHPGMYGNHLEADEAAPDETKRNSLSIDSDDDDPLFRNQKKQRKKEKQKQQEKDRKRNGKRKQEQAEESKENMSFLTNSELMDEVSLERKGQKTENMNNGQEEEANNSADKIVQENDFPLNVVYCAICGMPPEYCEFGPKKRDLDNCERWLFKNHPKLFSEIYPGREVEFEDSKSEDEDEESKDDGKYDESKIFIQIEKRGNKKAITTIVGLEKFGCDLHKVAKQLGKKLGTGTAVIKDTPSLEYIQVQGCIKDRLEDFLVYDLKEYKITHESIEFNDKTKTKKVKKKDKPKGVQEEKHLNKVQCAEVMNFGSSTRQVFNSIAKPQNEWFHLIDNSYFPFVPIVTRKVHYIGNSPELDINIVKVQNQKTANKYKYGCSVKYDQHKQQETEKDKYNSLPNPYMQEIVSFDESIDKIKEFSIPKNALKYKLLSETPLTYVQNEEKLVELVAKLEKATEIAIDLEHHSVRTYLGITSLMQISTREEDFIVDTLALRETLGDALRGIFDNPNITKVLHGSDSDVMWLQQDFGLYIVNMFDTGQASRVLSKKKASLAFLLKEYCEIDADKQYQLADWRLRPLTDEMIHYAREDTHYLLYIYDQLRIELVTCGTEADSEDPYAFLKKVMHNSSELCLCTYEKPVIKDYKYRLLLLEHRRRLSQEQFRVFKLLVKWRDYLARLNDESVDFVMPTSFLEKIAEDMPTSHSELFDGQRFTDAADYLKKNCDELILNQLFTLIKSKLQKEGGVISPQDDAENLQIKGSLEENDNVKKGVDFVINQAHASINDQKADKNKKVQQKVVDMPLQFDSKEHYLAKLYELIHTEAEIEKIQSEYFAMKDIPWKFEKVHKVTCKIEMKVKKQEHRLIRQGALLQIVIPLVNTVNQKTVYYNGVGHIYKVGIVPRTQFLKVILQIDVVYPLNKDDRQNIPVKSVEYENYLYFRIRYDDSYTKMQKILVKRALETNQQQFFKGRKDEMSEGRRIIQRCIWQGIARGEVHQAYDVINTLGMENWNPSQSNAILKAMKERITLIQGPPGTGKTRVIAGLVANMLSKISVNEKILVITTMNSTADLLAQELYKIPLIREYLVRTYSYTKEDLFNVKFDELVEYSMLYKMIHDKQLLNDFSRKITEELNSKLDFDGSKEARAKYQIEFQFGKSKYKKDYYMHDQEEAGNWIDLDWINNDFPKMLDIGLETELVYNSLRHSTVVDISKHQDGRMMVRQKPEEVKLSFLGYDPKQINELSKPEFEEFLKHKEKFEEVAIQKFPIIVTTAGYAATKVIRDLKIKRVVVDEATQVKEQDMFLSTLSAEQIVLVGDQQQLGPTLSFKINGPTSMFSRLIQVKYPFTFLDTQYRMHSSLMKVPNELFYNNMIKCGYMPNLEKQFMFAKDPFLFIDVPNGYQQMRGTSMYNNSEVNVMTEFTKLILNQFELHKDLQGFPTQKFQRSSICVITPYNAQKDAIVEEFYDLDMADQVISIDSSQGREFDLVFISTVRTSPGAFMSEYNRINVAITRAKHGLVIIGNAKTLRKDPKWAKLLQIHSKNVVEGLEGASKWIVTQRKQYKKTMSDNPWAKQPQSMKFEDVSETSSIVNDQEEPTQSDEVQGLIDIVQMMSSQKFNGNQNSDLTQISSLIEKLNDEINSSVSSRQEERQREGKITEIQQQIADVFKQKGIKGMGKV